jgi:hypothetical protein
MLPSSRSRAAPFVAIALAAAACSSQPAAEPDAGADGASDVAPASGDGSSDSAAGDGFVGKACTGCPPPTACSTCWHPAPLSRWQYQLQTSANFAQTGGVNTAITSAPFGGGSTVAPDVFDIDLYAIDGTTPNAAATAALHQAGKRALCYVDAGTYEDFRPDAADYTSFDGSCSGCLLGSNNGWPGEKWLDVSDDKGQRTFILQELGKRMDACAAAGFDGVELDNVDGYANSTGFTITAAAQEYFNAAIANLAHSKGLSVALKNDLEQVADLEPYFDYAVNEQCFELGECAMLQPFVAAGKAVFNVEYNAQPSQFCAPANTQGIEAIAKTLALNDTPWTPCQ